MGLIVTNNNQVTLGLAILSTDTTMTVSSVVGMPDVSGAGDYTTLSLINVSTGSIEYVKATDLDTLNRIYTIERAQEGTLALDFPLASEVRNFFTAGMFQDLASSASSAMQTASHTIDGTLSVANPAGTNSDILILAKYGNQLIEGTDYTISGGGETISFIGTQAIETEVVTFVYSTPAVGSLIEQVATANLNTDLILRGDGLGGVEWVEDDGGLNTQIIVRQASDFGIIDSTKVYRLDGVIDMGATSIVVPPTGITIIGDSFDVSGLTSSEDGYTMFVSESIAIGSGNILGTDYHISVTGAGSKVYELYDATGFNAFEFTRVNYNDCTNLGDIYNYRQGLELGTGRFGGSPSLTLHGIWLGGYRITTSIVRGLAGTMTEPLFKEGLLFEMRSRFLTDINVDLPTLAPLLDFVPTNFPNPSTLQLRGCIITRDGATDPLDANICSNIVPADLCTDFKDNKGFVNTFVGGGVAITAEATTTISVIDTFVDVAGTFVAGSLQHFDSPAGGQLRHLGNDPREFRVHISASVEGTANNTLQLKLVRWDNSLSSFVDVVVQSRPVNNLQGGRDFAYFDVVKSVELDIDDYLLMQLANTSSTDNITMELDSYMLIEER